MFSKFDVLDEFELTTWSLVLMISYANSSVELETISYLEKYLKNPISLTVLVRATSFFHSFNIIIDLMKVRTQEINADLLATINVRVKVGDFT